MMLKQLYATLRLYTNFFSTDDEAQKQRAFWQSREELSHHKLLINECWLVPK